MKTHTIKTPTAELLVVEVPNGSYYEVFNHGIYIKDDDGERGFIKGHFTLLGKPDEIREDDAKELVEDPIDKWGDDNFRFLDYRYDEYYDLFTAKESLLSLLETEIFWENPTPLGDFVYSLEEWHEAEQKTFDRKRSIILKKNK